jgi:hypothetical protein
LRAFPRDYSTVNPDQDATFQGQAPIHVKMNENGKMELDEKMHETATGSSSSSSSPLLFSYLPLAES